MNQKELIRTVVFSLLIILLISSCKSKSNQTDLRLVDTEKLDKIVKDNYQNNLISYSAIVNYHINKDEIKGKFKSYKGLSEYLNKIYKKDNYNKSCISSNHCLDIDDFTINDESILINTLYSNATKKMLRPDSIEIWMDFTYGINVSRFMFVNPARNMTKPKSKERYQFEIPIESVMNQIVRFDLESIVIVDSILFKINRFTVIE